jgi:hypothetical protein
MQFSPENHPDVHSPISQQAVISEYMFIGNVLHVSEIIISL